MDLNQNQDCPYLEGSGAREGTGTSQRAHKSRAFESWSQRGLQFPTTVIPPCTQQQMNALNCSCGPREHVDSKVLTLFREGGNGPCIREIVGTIEQSVLLSRKLCTSLVPYLSSSEFWHYKRRERSLRGCSEKWHIPSACPHASEYDSLFELLHKQSF